MEPRFPEHKPDYKNVQKQELRSSEILIVLTRQMLLTMKGTENAAK
jgi:hypothetical protein